MAILPGSACLFERLLANSTAQMASSYTLICPALRLVVATFLRLRQRQPPSLLIGGTHAGGDMRGIGPSRLLSRPIGRDGWLFGAARHMFMLEEYAASLPSLRARFYVMMQA